MQVPSMDNNKLVRKLYAYRKDPDLYKAPSNEDLADLVILVLNAVKTIESSIEQKRIDVESKYDQQAKAVLSQAKNNSETLMRDVRKEVERLIAEGFDALDETQSKLESRVQQAIENIRNGENGIVTEEEIERAAAVAYSMLELPDFDELVMTQITANGQAVRDALELLSGEERYKVQITDVDGLERALNELAQIRSAQGGTIGKQQVYGFIRQAVADGTISTGGASTLDELTDVNVPSPSTNDVLTWDGTEWVSAAPPGAGGGEANTASNLGTGEGTFASKVGVDLRFKSLVGGTGVTLSSDGNEITINRDALTASDITDFDTEVSNNTDVAANTTARHDAVTLAGTPNYITIVGQVITRALIDLTSHVTGRLPFANLAQLSAHQVLGRAGAGTGDAAGITMGNDTILGRVGSGDIDDLSVSQVKTMLGVGAANGIAELDAGGLVPASQLPSFVDDILEYANLAAFPGTGETGKIYVALDTNLTYRWSGSAYVEISASLALGETSSTAYRGDRGKIAYDYSQIGHIPAFADPNADRIVFWDDSAGAFAALTASTGLTLSGTNLTVRTASTTQTGIVELATDAETVTGTDTARATTPANLTARLAAPGTIGGTTPGAATFTDLTSTGVLTYDAARGKVTAGGNLGATETINFNDETNYTGTLDSNITFTFANATSGDDVTLYLSYDGTAQRTITWPTITWLDNATGAAPTAPAASGNVLVVTIRYIGTTYYGSATGNYAVYA